MNVLQVDQSSTLLQIQQTRQAYAFWNAPDMTPNVFMLTPKGAFLGLPCSD